MDDHTLDPKATELRRFEVITGTGRRRRWSAEAKARIVAESLVPGAQVSDVARRHGIRPQQLFGWRRAARGECLAPKAAVPPFVPVVTELRGESGMSEADTPGVITIEIGGAVVRAARGADLAWLRDVLRCVKAAT
jgi:transposase